MKARWKYVVSILLFSVLMIFSEEAKDGAAQGLRLWWELLIPAMFPAFAAMSFMRSVGASDALAAWLGPFLRRTLGIKAEAFLILFAGLSAGYPLGARALCDSVSAGRMTKEEADRLYRTCDNTGPAFAVGAIGIGLFSSVLWGLVLWIIHAVTALFLTVIFSRKDADSAGEAHKASALSLGRCLSDSVSGAVSAMISIGGYVVLFSALPIEELFRFLCLPQSVSAALRGSLELVSGIGSMSGMFLSPVSLALAEFLLSFGGLCVHLQSLAVTEKACLNGKERLGGKLLHGVLSSSIAYAIGRIVL